jgi:putative chitinase
MNINRERFFKRYREEFGRLSQAQVAALGDLLTAIENDPQIEDMRDVSYILATIKHETAHTFEPIEEYGKGRGHKYGIADKETGQKYYGRGYVQLTWRKNYQTFADLLSIDLVNKPKLALDPNVAWQITSIGMRKGLFTGKKLSDFINDKKTDYLGARKIINGTDKAQLIAGYAEQFEEILSSSELTADENLNVIQQGAALVDRSPSQPSIEAQAATGNLSSQPGQASAQETPSQTKLELKDGNLKLETSESPAPPENVAIEKPPVKSFGAEIKKDLGAVGLGEVGLQGVREAAEGAKFLGLSARFWVWVSIIAIVAGAAYLIAKVYKHWTETRRDLEITNQLISANSTDSNKVVLMDSDKAAEFAKAGYKIIHR